jgi:hypothetical protein
MSMIKTAIENNLFQKLNIKPNPDLMSLLIYLTLTTWSITGNVAEIGVAHGTFFIPLALCCDDDEVAIAIDVFEEREANWNPHGGSSDTARLRALSEAAGVGSITRFVVGDSLNVESKSILSVGNEIKTKLFSVDGAHSVHHTVNDLELASSVTMAGGVVFLDDVKNWGWPGVIEGFSRYSLLQPFPRLVPFLLFGNKFLLTTASHQHRWLKASVAYAESIGRKNESTYRVSRFFGWDAVGW